MVVVAIPLAFVAGLITAISPCVLPVLPIVLGGGVGENRRRPYAIIAGLATCFLVSILFAAWLLDALGLPDDLLRNISIGLLFLLAATLLFPQVGVWIERPLARLSRRPSGDLGGGFLLGCALGFVFVPCGGPAIAFVTSSAAAHDFGFKTIGVAVAYTPAPARCCWRSPSSGQRFARRLRAHVEQLRIAFGVVLAASALALVFDLDTKLQTWLPNWTQALQDQTEAVPPGRAVVRADEERHGQDADRAHAHAERSEGLRPGAELHRQPGLAEHARRSPADPAEAPRQGRARRLLDLLLHQLPAHAPLPRELVPNVREGRLRHRRSAHAGVRVRARRLQRARGDQGVRRPLPGRDRQRVRRPGTPTATSTGRPST